MAKKSKKGEANNYDLGKGSREADKSHISKGDQTAISQGQTALKKLLKKRKIPTVLTNIGMGVGLGLLFLGAGALIGLAAGGPIGLGVGAVVGTSIFAGMYAAMGPRFFTAGTPYAIKSKRIKDLSTNLGFKKKSKNITRNINHYIVNRIYSTKNEPLKQELALLRENLFYNTDKPPEEKIALAEKYFRKESATLQNEIDTLNNKSGSASKKEQKKMMANLKSLKKDKEFVDNILLEISPNTQENTPVPPQYYQNYQSDSISKRRSTVTYRFDKHSQDPFYSFIRLLNQPWEVKNDEKQENIKRVYPDINQTEHYCEVSRNSASIKNKTHMNDENEDGLTFTPSSTNDKAVDIMIDLARKYVGNRNENDIVFDLNAQNEAEATKLFNKMNSSGLNISTVTFKKEDGNKVTLTGDKLLSWGDTKTSHSKNKI